jgi:hypothetical protein
MTCVSETNRSSLAQVGPDDIDPVFETADAFADVRFVLQVIDLLRQFVHQVSACCVVSQLLDPFVGSNESRRARKSSS